MGVVALTVARPNRLRRGDVSARRLCAWQRLRLSLSPRGVRHRLRESSPSSFNRGRRGNTDRSLPSAAPHCPINCSSSSCLGTNARAFTGVQQSNAGHIKSAARGVLFLDEVSAMSLAAQVKVLRFV
jgi:hypothetical protein